MHTLALITVFLAAAPPGEGLTLEEATRRALQDNPLVDAARGTLDEYEARYRQVVLAWVPQVRVDFTGTVLPKMTGNAVEHDTDESVWGPYLRTQATLVQPVTTFGRLALLKKMAAAGMDVGRAQIRMAEDEIRFMTARAYYSLVFASEMEGLIAEGEEFLEKARRRLEELEEKDADDFDQVDLLRLRVYEAEVASMRLEAARGASLARTSLHLLTGLPEEEIRPSMKHLETASFDDWDLPRLQALAEGHRPDLEALRAGVRAMRLGVDVERRKWAPDVFLLGNMTMAWAPYVENQRSPFADDPYNTTLGSGAALGIRWTMDVGGRLAGVDEARAGLRKLEGQLRGMLLKARLELAQKLGEAQDARARIEIHKRAYKAGRGWAMAKTDLYENGLEELKQVIEGISKFYSTKLAYMDAILRFDLAVAELARACGVPTSELAPRSL
ncbi:MAG: TolC family protein [Deltaproteobacteria bacterium]|nr:TolC family protein [Deltaproteobacteria bacterium]